MIDTDFVGRQGHLERILEVGDPDGGGAFFDVEGIPGIGKTSLLGKLAKVARERLGPDGIQEIVPVPIDCEGPAFMAPRQPGTAPAGEDVMAGEGAEYREFRRMLGSALDNLPDDDAKSTIRQALDQHQSAPGGGLNYVTNNPVWEPRDLVDLRNAEAETLTAVTEATEAAARNLAIQGRRLLILVDQFHLLEGRPLGRWLTALLAGVTSATVVVAHQRFRDPGGAGLPDRTIALPLRNLSREDVKTYLNIRTDPGPEQAKVYDQVWHFTDGHPGALALAADFVRENRSAEDSVRHIRQIGALQGGREDQLRDLVTRILRAINDDDLRYAMACACVTRHFDEPLLARLLDDPDPGHVQRLIDRLTDYSFVYRVAANDESAGPRFLAISDFVRSIGAERLGTRQSEIHRRAAEYYREGIVGKWAEDDTSYASWLRYEDPEFQVMVSDWLYHLSNLTGSDRKTGRAGIARIFLDAFWWWGSYISFPFCDEILADWNAVTQADQNDRAWADALRTLYKSFPKGWPEPATSPGQWARVLGALSYLRGVGGYGVPDPGTPDIRHVRGILDLLLAEATHAVDPDDPDAEELLDDAAQQFAADKDDWNAAWVEFCRADFDVSRDRADEAIALVEGNARAYAALGDDELMANLHRVHADAQWARGNPAAALDDHAHAVLHAYAFHMSVHPDHYTETFYQEMVERSIEHLQALHAGGAGPENATLTSACARIRAFFGPYWRANGASAGAGAAGILQALTEGRISDVARGLFPAGPTRGDLTNPGSAYEQTGHQVLRRMARQLAEPPGTPLPAADGTPR